MDTRTTIRRTLISEQQRTHKGKRKSFNVSGPVFTWSGSRSIFYVVERFRELSWKPVSSRAEVLARVPESRWKFYYIGTYPLKNWSIRNREGWCCVCAPYHIIRKPIVFKWIQLTFDTHTHTYTYVYIHLFCHPPFLESLPVTENWSIIGRGFYLPFHPFFLFSFWNFFFSFFLLQWPTKRPLSIREKSKLGPQNMHLVTLWLSIK